MGSGTGVHVCVFRVLLLLDLIGLFFGFELYFRSSRDSTRNDLRERQHVFF